MFDLGVAAPAEIEEKRQINGTLNKDQTYYFKIILKQGKDGVQVQVKFKPSVAAESELGVGRVHSRVGSGRVGSGWVRSGPDFFLTYWVGSGRVHLCGSPWIMQSVTLSVIVKFTQFSELLVLLKLFSV